MASILLPSLSRARETANRVKCASNERQIGQAILLYSNDNKGKYPPDLGTLIKTQDITIPQGRKLEETTLSLRRDPTIGMRFSRKEYERLIA